MLTEYFGPSRSTPSSLIRYTRVTPDLFILIENELPLVNDFALKPVAQILRILNAGPSRKSCQTILYLKSEIKPFSLFSADQFMFFRSRIDASAACVIGHAVYR